MSDERWQAAKLLFEQAMQRPEPQRQAFLESACEDDPLLFKTVFDMLCVQTHAEELQLSRLVSEQAEQVIASLEPLNEGELVGQYRIVSKIAEGGMGAVYLGQRADDSYDQMVAIKLLHGRLMSQDALERFTRERQILADLRHHNIARLLDGGTTENGIPFLVMEYVQGQPLLPYMESRKLSLQSVLDIFLQVCDAIEYAHQHLVIHQDIKPANILVSEDNQVRLVDFGIATILQPTAGKDKDTHSANKWAMTPESASPEQILKQTISTRTDVYALGVLLYRMLAGQSPYHDYLRDLASLQKAILEHQPPPPSHVIRPQQLRKSVIGDLDAIVAMAMSKDPQQRYTSASALADDVRNHLRKLPVKARPQSIGYLSYKLLLRYPKTLLGSAFAASVFVATVLFYSYQVAQQRDLAEQRLATAEQISDFMVDVFSISDPEEALGNTVTAREILDQGALKIETTLTSQPDVQYALRHTLGKVYLSLGLKQPAKEMLEKERAYRMANRESNPQALIDNSIAYASLLAYLGEPGQAREVLEDAQLLQSRISGSNSLEMANVYVAQAKLNQLFGDFDQAKSLIDKTLEIQNRLLPEDSTETLRSELLKNVILSELGLFDEAIASSHAVIEKSISILGERHPIVSEGYRDLGFYLKLTGEYADAKQALLKALSIDKAVYGEEHYTIALDLYELGSLLSFTDQDKAIDYLQQVLVFGENILSKLHWTRAVAHNDLANIFSDQLRYEESEYHYLKSLEINRATFGDVHPEIATNHTNLGLLYMEMKRFEDAQRHLDIGMSIRRQVYPESHPHIAASLSVMGSLRFAQQQYEDALEYFSQSLDMKLQFHKPESGMILAARGRIARALIMLRRFDEAEQNVSKIISDSPQNSELSPRERKYIYSTMTEFLKAPIPCASMVRLYPKWQPIFSDVLVDTDDILGSLSDKYQQCQNQ